MWLRLLPSALAHFLGVAEFVHQALVALGLFQRRQILALDVLDQRDLERFTIRQLTDDDGT